MQVEILRYEELVEHSIVDKVFTSAGGRVLRKGERGKGDTDRPKLLVADAHRIARKPSE
jgi:hypothetical protein